jgi:hypothetical protein
MKYLLDTHTYLWYRSSPRALPRSILRLLTDTSHEILISIATPWELAIKTGIGKLNAAALDFEGRETAGALRKSRPRAVPDCCPFTTKIRPSGCAGLRIPIVSRDSFDLYGVSRIWD